MENYVKGEVKELEDEPVFHDILLDGAIHMKVKSGSKVRNLLGFAIKKMKDPETKQMVWAGNGQSAVTKVITSAEIIKRKFKNLHQVNDIRFKRIEEYWEPKTSDLERLKVNRDIPMLTILLSKEPLNPNLLGYQGPGETGEKMRQSSSQAEISGDVASNSGPKNSLKRRKKTKPKPGKKSNTENTSKPKEKDSNT